MNRCYQNMANLVATVQWKTAKSAADEDDLPAIDERPTEPPNMATGQC